ncbi:MAG: hypothetical protein Q8R37_02590 [Nanoarchaeota archaeon]|nr:hypothetical protein [Nanoarchaeota archaeon]
MAKIDTILIEGPDCSGKTTLVEQLKNTLHWDAKALHHRQGDQFLRYLKEYTQQQEVIFNRGHYSEAVYGQLWRGGNPFSNDEKELLDQFCRQRMLVIFTCPPLELMTIRYSQRHYKQQIKIEELEQSRQLFCEVLKDIPHITYTSQHWEELEQVIETAQKIVRDSGVQYDLNRHRN